MDYKAIFDDVFDEWIKYSELMSVRTSDMGSLFRLKYQVQLNGKLTEEQLFDKIRERNGNLETSISRNFTKDNEL